MQETKLQSKATEGIEESLDLPGWHFFWACSEVKKGYSGTAVFSRSGHFSQQTEYLMRYSYSDLHNKALSSQQV